MPTRREKLIGKETNVQGHYHNIAIIKAARPFFLGQALYMYVLCIVPGHIHAFILQLVKLRLILSTCSGVTSIIYYSQYSSLWQKYHKRQLLPKCLGNLPPLKLVFFFSYCWPER